MHQPNPPQLPPGWIALWDETSQRYYYVEQATGTTQWDIPTGTSLPEPNYSHGESPSYGNGYPPNSMQRDYSSYSPQQQTLPQPGESGGYNGSSSNSPAYPNQQPYGGQQPNQHQQQQPGMPGESGGYNGSSSNSPAYPNQQSYGDQSPNQHQQQQPGMPGESSGYNGSSSNSPAYPNQQSYADQSPNQHQQQQPGMPGEGGPEGERGLGKVLTNPITAGLIGLAAGKYLGGNKPSHHQSSGGFGAIGNFFQHQQQQPGGYGNYGRPPPQAQAGFLGYNPPPPSNYGGGYAKPPKKFGFF